MAFSLTEEEQLMIANCPEDDLVSLASELNLIIPERIGRMELAAEAIVAFAKLAKTEGLPFSRYSREDLNELAPHQREALARLCGASSSVDGMIKHGEKVFKKKYRRHRPNSQILMMLPALLIPLARYAYLQGS